MTVTAAPDIDYDRDDDGLIEIGTMSQLDALRHDRYGAGHPTSTGRDAYTAAFPGAADGMGCPAGCAGYELRTDLDFDTNGSGAVGEGDAFWNDGSGWVPIKSYDGIFDGNRHAIGNLFVDRDGDVGLFRTLGFSAEVRRVGLVGTDVSGDGAGALAATNRGTVEATYAAAGRVAGQSDAGGLVGSNAISGKIEGSFAAVDVSGQAGSSGGLAGGNSGDVSSSYATGRVTGTGETGGLVGWNSVAGVVRASYATGRVTGDAAGTGGLAGRNSGEIGTCFATGPVAGGEAVGGLVGWQSAIGEIRASYWDTDTTSRLSGRHGAGATTASLQTPTDYAGLYAEWNADIDGDGTGDDPWRFGTAAQYPALATDFDGDGQASWQEFGHQLREGPALAVSTGQGQAHLVWTAADTDHWSPAPEVTYTVTRDEATAATGILGLRYSEALPVRAVRYQVAAVVRGGEATRSARTTTNPTGNRPPVAAETLPDRTLHIDGDSIDIDVASAFEDPEGDVLTFGASSSAPGVSEVAMSGSVATVTAVSAGVATITVTAVDEGGSKTATRQSFGVTVVAKPIDYDRDDDGLIEVGTLSQLDAIRYDTFTNGRPGLSGRDAYEAAFPAAADGMGCADGCSGYELRADLDFDTDGSGDVGDGDAYWDDGAGWAPIKSYDGVFDGNGHTVSNLFVNGAGDAGLFRTLGSSAEIRRLGLVGADVTGDGAGALAATNRGEVASTYAMGRVAGQSDVGGLVGSNARGNIDGSFATVDVSGQASSSGGLAGRNSGNVLSSYATGTVTGTGETGGLVGRNALAGVVRASYATGRVTGGSVGTGGLVGRNSGEVGGSFATGPVAGSEDVGGLVGSQSLLGETTASYWDTDTTGRLTGEHGTGATTAALQAPTGYEDLYAAWNADLDGAADDRWRFGTAAQYPALATDFDGDGQASWQEFGHQLREGPALVATAGDTGNALTWTAVDAMHWDPSPAVTYAVSRDGETIGENIAMLRYDDSSAVAGETYAYQVAAVVSGGEATRSAIESVNANDGGTSAWALGGGREPDAASVGGRNSRGTSAAIIPDPILRLAVEKTLRKTPGEAISADEVAGLATLTLRGAGVGDIAGLQYARNLLSLDIGHNIVADWSPVSSLRSLESLNVDGASPDLALVARLTNLRHLSMRSNGVADLSPLEGLTGLTELDVGDNRIVDLYPLAGMRDLWALHADGNQIQDLNPLSGLNGLRVLSLASNRVADLYPLGALRRLRTLSLGRNRLVRLDPLMGLPLVDLRVNDNELSDVQPLSYLALLERLDLQGNRVREIHPLAALSNLVWLDVAGNCIEDFTSLDFAPQLTVVGRDEQTHRMSAP